MKFNIKDVAKKAGYSTATVSRVLNNKGNVKEKTRADIQNVVKEMDFVLNQPARHLRSNKTHTIGIIVSDLLSTYDIEILKGIESVAYPAGYSTIICDCDNVKNQRRDMREKEYLKILYEGTVDGVIMIHSHLKIDDYRTLLKSNYKFSVLGVDLEELNIPSIMVDKVYGTYEAVKHLCEHGYRKIAYIYGREQIDQKLWRVNGLKCALEEFHLEFYEEYHRCGLFTEAGGGDAFVELMQLPDPPDAIFCGNDEMSLGVLKMARKMNISIPGQVGLIGHDDIRLCQLSNPTLSSVRQPKHEIGVLLFERMIQTLENKDPDYKFSTIVLKPELVLRESCGC